MKSPSPIVNYSFWAPVAVSDSTLGIIIMREVLTNRTVTISNLCHVVVNNLMPVELQALDPKRRFAHLVTRLAQSKQARAGDIGEILATEYIVERGDYPIFIRRLREKDLGKLPMRGDDLLAFRRNENGITEVLKGESKARERLGESVLREAANNLGKEAGRPTPHSVSFVAAKLRQEYRDSDAEVVEQILLNTVSAKHIQHFVFSTSGNDPEPLARAVATAHKSSIACQFVGLHLADYAGLISEVFGQLNGTQQSRNN